MEKNNNKKDGSRRWFLSALFSGVDEKFIESQTDQEMVKMLTPDGKLVEISKSVFEKASKGNKATNSDIYKWMENPSKDKK
jgi:hypothetical protein